MELKLRFNNSSNKYGIKEELLGLAKYQAAINTLKDYAKEQSLEIKHTDNNIFEQKCRRQIGNFSYGTDNVFEIPEKIRLTAIVERYTSENTSIAINMSGEETLINRIKTAYENAQPLKKDEAYKLIKEFLKDKLECYGHCKRD